MHRRAKAPGDTRRRLLPSAGRAAFTLLEVAVSLAISGVVAVAAISVYVTLTRTIRTTEQTSALNVAAALIDDHLRLLVRNLGGGALHPGQLVFLKNSANTIDGRSSDRLILARAVGDGVIADDVSSSGGGYELEFDAVIAETGARQCPLTTVPLDADGVTPRYDLAVTFFGVGTPVLLVSDGRSGLYRGAGVLSIETDPSDDDFQDCEYSVELDADADGDPLPSVGEVAIFPVRLETLQLVGSHLPASLAVSMQSATHAQVGQPAVVHSEALEFWPTTFDFQVQAGFDTGSHDGLIADGEWTSSDGTACARWPSCVSALTTDVRDLRQLRYGAVLGTKARPAGSTSTATLTGSSTITSTSFQLRAVQGRATLRNTVQRR